MSEASGRQEMERKLIQRSLEEDAFRQRLLADPKAAVEQELGMGLPEEVRVEAVEESADTIYLVLPSAPPLGEGAELSDRDLEAVAGWSPTSGGRCTSDDMGVLPVIPAICANRGRPCVETRSREAVTPQ
jgi:hypothetical protein